MAELEEGLWAGETDAEDRVERRIELEEEGALGAFGEAEAVDFFADLLGHEVHVGLPLEFEGDVGLAGLGHGADGNEFGDDAELLFEGAGDDALHFLGGGAGVNGPHGEGGVAHVGHEREGEALKGDPAEDDDGHHDHEDRDGALDGEGVEGVVGPEFRGAGAHAEAVGAATKAAGAARGLTVCRSGWAERARRRGGTGERVSQRGRRRRPGGWSRGR